MPTYEYTCSKGHHFELFQKMSDKPKARCPNCGAVATRKISAGAGLVFKGSGFYITDYGKDGKKAERAEKAEKTEKADKVDKTDKPKAEPAPRSEGGAKAASTDKPARKGKSE